MTTRFSRRAIARALLTTSALVASPALAQLAPPAPVRQSVDANGVNLFDGTFNVEGPELTIGPSGQQGLQYYKLNRGGGWTDNLFFALNLSGSVMTVSLGGTSDTFTVSGTTYTNTEGNGSTLIFDNASKVYTYTRADGTIIHFNQNIRSNTPYYSNEGRVTDVVLPSGDKLVFTYQSQIYCYSWKQGGTGLICMLTAYMYRPATVRNSYGYQLSFNYSYDYEYDPDAPDIQPDFYAWSDVTGASATNLAVANGATTRSQSWATANVGSTNYYQVTDPMGRLTKYRMNGNVVGITLPGSTAEDLSIGYASGRVSTIVTPAGTTSYLASDLNGVRTVTVTDPLNHSTTYKFDIASQRLTSVIDPNNNTTAAQYDSSGRLTRVTQPEGNYTQVAYDARGNVTEQRSVAKSGSGLADIVVTASYDISCANPKTCNQPNWTKDAKGNQTDYTYDSGHGGVLSVTAPAPTTGAVRPQTRYSYSTLQAYFKNSNGNVVASGEPVTVLTGTSACQTGPSCTGTADEVKTSVSYGPQTAGVGNNLLPVSTSSGDGTGALTATTAFSYDDVGNLTYVDGPLSGTADTTRNLYNADREAIGKIDPDPDGSGTLVNRAVRSTIDSRGLVTKQELGTTNGQTDTAWAAFSAAQAVDLGYDARRRVATRKLSAGSTEYALTQTSYNADDTVDCTATRMNPAAFGTLPSSACALGTQGSFGPDRISQFVYDAAGRPLKLKEAVGTPDEATERTIGYTPNGVAATLTDAENNRTDTYHDGFDRLSKIFYPSITKGSGVTDYADNEQFGYDANGNLVAYANRSGSTLSLTYDNLNRLVFKDLPGSEPDVTYSYDLLGRLTAANRSGASVAFGYDALSRQVSENVPLGAFNRQYDLAGRLTQLTWWDGFYVNYDHLVTGELSKVRENGATSGVGVLTSYGYDNLRRRTSVSFGSGAAQSSSWDPVSRLSQLTVDVAGTSNDLTKTFAYNPASQIVSETRSNDSYAYAGLSNGSTAYVSNGLNQLTSSGGTPVSYDANGNLANDGTSTYAYSSENLLKTTIGGRTFYYDGLNRLLGYDVTGGLVFTNEGSNIAAEVNNAGTIQKRYVVDDGGTLLAQYIGSGSGNRQFAATDERGSVISLSDALGSSIAINRYDEYGVPGATNGGRFEYTGQAWIGEVGIYSYRNRVYKPELGRFLQPDPIGYAGDGPNLYAYVLNDPVNFSDPTGNGKDKPKVTSWQRNADGTYSWTSSNGLSGTWNPSDNQVTVTSPIIITGLSVASTTNAILEQPSSWADYVSREFDYLEAMARYEARNAVAELVGINTPPPPAPKPPTPPILNSSTLQTKNDQLTQYFYQQRGRLESTRMRVMFGIGKGLELLKGFLAPH